MREKVLRALRISGRRLVQLGEDVWGVMRGHDRRMSPLVRADGETVMQLVAAGEIVSAGEQIWVLAPELAAHQPRPPMRWVFTATGARRPGERMRGVGFVGLARQAREGSGPITLRQTEAGLRLISDAERASADARLTMDWDAGPTTKQRRGGSAGGRAGDALAAAARLRRVRARVGDETWRLLWMLCVDGDTLSRVMARFGISQAMIKGRVAGALEDLAAAYDG